MSVQDYTVNYTINVEATNGVRQVQAFADSVEKISKARLAFGSTVGNIDKMMKDVDKVFKTKDGKARKFNYSLSIDTKSTEDKLKRVQASLTEISTLSKGINLVINAGKPVDAKALKANAKKLVDDQKKGNNVGQHFLQTQKALTKSVGKINATFAHLNKGGEVNIRTDDATRRLRQILTLLRQIRTTAGKGIPLNLTTGGVAGKQASVPYAPRGALPTKTFYPPSHVQFPPVPFARAPFVPTAPVVQAVPSPAATSSQRPPSPPKPAVPKTQAIGAIREAYQASRIDDTIYGTRRRSAINRLQYSRPISARSLPLAYMLNGYMLLSGIRSEIMEAVEYANIMESARSILRVADTDISSFEGRFAKMAQSVRNVGVETKFTAIEVAGAVKYLSMAGQSIETINESIRPITNLALIGDNDIAEIADLTTNIMAGYDIKPGSMPSVADIIASTISRSNVNIIETAESFKMAAGTLRMAGIDFTEASAAIGLLGNMGLKGTMSGTSLRAIATRLASQPRTAKMSMERLGVQFTEVRDISGKKVEKFRPLADIFEDMNKAGATLEDMHKIFGVRGANAGMMFLQNYEKLRQLTANNRASHGISSELAQVKQETTKGQWYQMTSQFTETFMKVYETIEPQIQGVLQRLLEKFKTPEFYQGLRTLSGVILDLFNALVSIGGWFARNFNWLEPIIFTGFVATKLFKLAGAVTNLGVAMGFLGKQSVASSGMQLLGSLVGGSGVKGVTQALTFGNKRAIVSLLQSAGISGKGAMTQALASAGIGRTASSVVARGATSGIFASQVATGRGLIGAGASIGALGAGAVAATAGITGLIGALGWVAYKTWKVKEAKDAVIAEIAENRKYRYPSIEALYSSLNATYEKALDTKSAIDDITSKTVQEVSGQKVGAFTGNWWSALISSFGAGQSSGYGGPSYDSFYSFGDAYQDDLTAGITRIAEMESQNRLNAAFGELAKARSTTDVGAFIQNVHNLYGADESRINRSLYSTYADDKKIFRRGLKSMSHSDAMLTWQFMDYQNRVTIPEIKRMAEEYKWILGSRENANSTMRSGGFDFAELRAKGFYFDDKTQFWTQTPLPASATDQQREDQLADFRYIHTNLVRFVAALRNTWGGSSEIAEAIVSKAGFPTHLYSNEPDRNDPRPFNASGITAPDGDEDDGAAGGNYSGTGKLSSVAPKQVIVNITNLLSVETIDLMKSPEGQQEEIKNFKDQMAQALIDVVHDFDASWNG